MPAPTVTHSGHKGTVVDDATGDPVADAEVTAESWSVGLPSHSKLRLESTVTARSDSSGHFSLPARRAWHRVLLLPDGGPVFLERICVKKPGYQPVVADPWTVGRPWEYKYPGQFRLKPGSHTAACFSP
jgi:hypothetical protein